ncbi:hypothetical protein ZWY2020_053963 [Hordeum vulgare]|nr:hypothetical protein ZWY2020_053963 [Hordeum vulgare]
MSSSSSPATQRRRLHPAAYLSAVAALLALVAAAFSRALGPRFPSPPAAAARTPRAPGPPASSSATPRSPSSPSNTGEPRRTRARARHSRSRTRR